MYIAIFNIFLYAIHLKKNYIQMIAHNLLIAHEFEFFYISRTAVFFIL